MTQEEKAKRYDEALERARKELQTCGSVNCDAAKQIFRLFPELKESENERIRKELIDFVKSRLAGFPKCGRFIAWLERQNIFSKKDVDDAYLKGITDAKNEIEKQYEIIFPTKLKGGELTWLTRYIEEEVYSLSMDIRDDEDRIKLKNLKKSLDWLEKQGEKPYGKSALDAIKEEKVDNQNCVKPTDKVKPRFHARGLEVVDCEENENLFLAIAALRTNTDKNQWFTDGEIVELCLDDMPSKYMQLNGHKCTVKELKNIF